jgi:hypothetical protein
MKATFDAVIPLTYTNLAPTCFVGCHLVIDFDSGTKYTSNIFHQWV